MGFVTHPLKQIAKVVSPYIAPIAALSGVGLPLAAALGAGTGLLSGGGLKGALVGGGEGALGAGGAGILGNYLSDAGGLGLSASQAGALGGLTGGTAIGGLSGGGLKGALTSGALGAAGGYIQGSGGFGNALDNLGGGLSDIGDSIGSEFNSLTGSGTDAAANGTSSVFKGAGDLSGAGTGLSSNGISGVNAGSGVSTGGGSSMFADPTKSLASGATPSIGSSFDSLGSSAPSSSIGSSFGSAATTSPTGGISGFNGVGDTAANLAKGTNAATSGGFFSNLFGDNSTGTGTTGMGKVNAAANIGSALISSGAQNNMKDELQKEQQQNQANIQPYLNNGTAANSRLSELLGIGGDPTAAGYGSLGQQFDPSSITSDPGYQFQLQQGQDAINKSLGAQGKVFSGEALKDAADYNQGLTSQTLNDYYNRWLTGQQNTYSQLSGVSNTGQQAASSLANINDNVGNINANSTLAQSNILNNTLSSILNGSGKRVQIGTDAQGKPIYQDDNQGLRISLG